MILYIMWENELCTTVELDETHKPINVVRHILRIPKQPIYSESITREQLYEFIKSRCFEECRPDKDVLLQSMELTVYNPWEIIKVTHGFQYDDKCWIKFEGESITWEDVYAEFDNSEEYKILSNSGSTGSQIKYFYQNKMYKLNMTGNEALAEYISSVLLSCSNASYVPYEKVTLNGKPACVSDNFLKSGESVVSLKSLYNMYTGKSLSEEIFKLRTVTERYDFVVDKVKEITGVDIAEYLNILLCLDYLLCNPDRHFGNIALITDGMNFRPAPIFDNGQGLGCNYLITPQVLTIDECFTKLTACTLSGSFEQQLECLMYKGLKLNYTRLYKELSKLPVCRATEILVTRLHEYKKDLSTKLNPSFEMLLNAANASAR